MFYVPTVSLFWPGLGWWGPLVSLPPMWQHTWSTRPQSFLPQVVGHVALDNISLRFLWGTQNLFTMTFVSLNHSLSCSMTNLPKLELPLQVSQALETGSKWNYKTQNLPLNSSMHEQIPYCHPEWRQLLTSVKSLYKAFFTFLVNKRVKVFFLLV